MYLASNSGSCQLQLHARVQVWAMLLYFDDVLGRLFEAVASSGLADSTYIMLTADNGPGLSRALLTDKMQRLVSVTNVVCCEMHSDRASLCGGTGLSRALLADKMQRLVSVTDVVYCEMHSDRASLCDGTGLSRALLTDKRQRLVSAPCIGSVKSLVDCLVGQDAAAGECH
jgi:hypothetical protein